MPIVQCAYTSGDVAYKQEVFALVRGPLSGHGALAVRFTAAGGAGRVSAHFGADKLRADDGSVLNPKGLAIARFGRHWAWSAKDHKLIATLKADQSADLLVLTRPAEDPAAKSFISYEDERKACVDAWRAILARGAQFQVPEPIVQNAWRALVIGNYLIADGERMNYSAGNAYDHLYQGECGDAVRGLMLFGQTTDARRMVGPLLDFNRHATRFHVAGHKLQLLAHYYWVTRDEDYLREKRPVWEPVVRFIRDSRKTDNGLLPKDNYAGDIKEQVYSLNSNANCWRGLRDMAAVLEDAGDAAAAADLRREADRFREVILDAVARSERRDTRPPFIPMSLLGSEEPHDPLTATRTGSYYDLMIPYVLGSTVFGPGSQREAWIIDYLRQHGGLSMGMIRSMPHQGEFKGEPGVNVLYGLRYQLTLLQRGDRNHALAGFYGHLAQAMTRDTFIGGEGSRFFHGDEQGRSFYLPPNSASNAAFLTVLRYLLIQDWDLDDDGRPETLRLLDAIPPRWLADGAVIEVKKAPTAVGEISFRVESKLKQGELRVSLDLPARPVKKWQLRLPDPPGCKITRVRLGTTNLDRDAEGRINLPLRAGPLTLQCQTEPEA